ncbi:MAG: hypothetical protein QOK19_2207 [Solirubrobacteraceae bacterium]|jgi:hypothetical protein|nr:hypothetical protein [Solirubrobacterales bacterium]MEA2216646.1 hypothetical protein [Solirubrobacteraceae bacterium]
MTITFAIAIIVLLDLALLGGLAAAIRAAYVRLSPPPATNRHRTEPTEHAAPRRARRQADSPRKTTRVPA